MNAQHAGHHEPVRVGLDVLLEEGLPLLEGKRVGLITNHSGVDSRLRSGIDLLRAASWLRLAALFGPEHGIRGAAQAGVHVGTTTDARTGLPAHSLYGETRQPTPEMLDGLDALVYDIQDIGSRYSTYIATLGLAQEAAARAGIPVVILDRPNPLNGVRVEGNLTEPAFESFVGYHPIAIRHGLTPGEVGRLVAAERGFPPPTVVPMRGWHRGMWYDETGLAWVQPSPNMPTVDTATVYPGTCLIEGTNVSEGRGTTRPFELIGAPWVDPFALAEELTERGLPGVGFRPAYFTPMFHKHAGELCGGVQVHVRDREALRPAALGIHLLHVLRHLYPDQLAWRQYADGRYALDRLMGTDRLRLALDAGASPAELMAGWEAQAAEYAGRREPHLLYE